MSKSKLVTFPETIYVMADGSVARLGGIKA